MLVSKAELEMNFHAFILRIWNFCNSLFTSHFKTVQNPVTELLTGANRRSLTTPVLASLYVLPNILELI